MHLTLLFDTIPATLKQLLSHMPRPPTHFQMSLCTEVASIIGCVSVLLLVKVLKSEFFGVSGQTMTFRSAHVSHHVDTCGKSEWAKKNH